MGEDFCVPYAVYGSLRPNCGNDGLWRGRAEVCGRSLNLPGFRLVTRHGLGFPFALRSDETDSIWVDLIYPKPEFAFELRRDLDVLEGYPDFYDRTIVRTKDFSAWLYLPSQPWRYRDLLRVTDGDWRQWIISF